MVGKVPPPGQKSRVGFLNHRHGNTRKLRRDLLEDVGATGSVAQNDLTDSMPSRPLAKYVRELGSRHHRSFENQRIIGRDKAALVEPGIHREDAHQGTTKRRGISAEASMGTPSRVEGRKFQFRAARMAAASSGGSPEDPKTSTDAAA